MSGWHETHINRWECLILGYGISYRSDGFHFVTPRTLTPGRVTAMAFEVLATDLPTLDINAQYGRSFADPQEQAEWDESIRVGPAE